MSEPENFLARWSRLKRETTLEGSAVSRNAPVDPLKVVDAPPAPAFDPASLPSIELIDAATDIRPFLEACVPEELTRAALRSTWSADPAIRDFVGIAEGQWDFNDPASIPGFGVHAAADYLGRLAVHGVESLETATEISAERSGIVDQQTLEGTGPTCSDPAEVAVQFTPTVSEPSDDDAGGGPAGDTRNVERFPKYIAPEGELGPRIARAHGGALPE
jgi:hypothetical protein